MTHRLTRVDIYVALWGGIASIATALIGGIDLLPSAVVGAVLASLNWLAFRKLSLYSSASQSSLFVGLLIGAKTLAVLVVVALLLVFLQLDPIALLVGMSGLFFGIISYGAALAIKTNESLLERKP